MARDVGFSDPIGSASFSDRCVFDIMRVLIVAITPN
jgi:hypothetical protein